MRRRRTLPRAPYGRSPPTRLVSARLRRSSSAGTTTPRSAFDTVPPPEASEHSGLLVGHTPHDTLSTPILERDGSGVTTLAVAGLRPLGNDALLPGTGLTGGQLRTHCGGWAGDCVTSCPALPAWTSRWPSASTRPASNGSADDGPSTATIAAGCTTALHGPPSWRAGIPTACASPTPDSRTSRPTRAHAYGWMG
jgi:hypothetical protein